MNEAVQTLPCEQTTALLHKSMRWPAGDCFLENEHMQFVSGIPCTGFAHVHVLVHNPDAIVLLFFLCHAGNVHCTHSVCIAVPWAPEQMTAHMPLPCTVIASARICLLGGWPCSIYRGIHLVIYRAFNRQPTLQLE